MDITKTPATISEDRTQHKPGGGFRNPWDSCKDLSLWTVAKTRWNAPKKVELPEESFLVPVRKPDLSSIDGPVRLTWLGHASFIVQYKSINILLDPVLVMHMSPVSFAGPTRFREFAVTMEELPKIDLVLISHNHYDHLDITTMQYIYGRDKCSIIAPLGNKAWFKNNGMEGEDSDWWDEYVCKSGEKPSVKVTCCPAQHGTARGVRDRNATLWCSWAIDLGEKKIYFAGDTGYRSVPDDATSEQVEAAPSCPAFKDIGERLGPFDIALLPIGCFLPKSLMSNIHMSPDDAVYVHKDVKAIRSLGMHYGTIRGSLSQHYEDVLEPVKRLKLACGTAGLEFGRDLFVCDIGETVDL